jgi:hypothetical protein
MSIACSVPLDGGRAARLLRSLAYCIPAAGLVASLVSLVSGVPAWLDLDPQASGAIGSGLHAVLMAIVATAALGFAWMAFRAACSRDAPGLLVLTATGMVCLDQQSFRLYAVSRLPGLIVVVLAPISDQRSKLARSPSRSRFRSLFRPAAHRVVMLGQDAQTPEQWRRLNVWLLWVSRANTSVSV